MDEIYRMNKENNKKEKKEKRNFFTDLKNLKRNYRIVKNHPLANARFKFTIQRNTLIVFSLFMVYQFYQIIINYSGSGIMLWVGRGISLLILTIIINKAYTSMKIAKKNLEIEENYYKNNPDKLRVQRKEDVKTEIDEILNQFGESNNEKSKKHPRSIKIKE